MTLSCVGMGTATLQASEICSPNSSVIELHGAGGSQVSKVNCRIPVTDHGSRSEKVAVYQGQWLQLKQFRAKLGRESLDQVFVRVPILKMYAISGLDN